MSARTSAAQTASGEQPALELQSISVAYNGITAVADVSLAVSRATVVALLGANGAGKTTTLRAAAGLKTVQSGKIFLDGVDVTAQSAHERTRRGICLIPQGRGIFRSLTVAENLQLQRDTSGPADYTRALEVFPVLKQKLDQVAGTLSGGQQQMLALSRAFLCDPKVILVDEVSMGLAPVAVEEMLGALKVLAERGLALLLVEQYVDQVLALADQVVVLRRGTVSLTAEPRHLNYQELVNSYLG
jgi:branched-chain amino acid transport system ATP-binding protein